MNTTVRNLLLTGPLALAFTLTAAPAATAYDNDGPVIVMPPSEPDPAPSDLAQPQPKPDPVPEGPDEVAQPDEPKPPKGPGDITQPEPGEVDPGPVGPGDVTQPEPVDPEVDPEVEPLDPATDGSDEPELDVPLDPDTRDEADLPGSTVEVPTDVDEGDAVVAGESGLDGDLTLGWLLAGGAVLSSALVSALIRSRRRA